MEGYQGMAVEVVSLWANGATAYCVPAHRVNEYQLSSTQIELCWIEFGKAKARTDDQPGLIWKSTAQDSIRREV